MSEVKYLIISYREECKDYCMGHVVDSSGSDFVLIDTTSPDQALRNLDHNIKAALREAEKAETELQKLKEER